MRQNKSKTSPNFFQNLSQSFNENLETLQFSERINANPLKNLSLPQQEQSLLRWLLVLPFLWLLAQAGYVLTGELLIAPSFLAVSFSFLIAYLLFSRQLETLRPLLSIFFLWQINLQWQSLAPTNIFSRILIFALQTLIYFFLWAFIFVRADATQKRKSLAILRLCKLLTSVVLLVGTLTHLYFAFTQTINPAFNLFLISSLIALPLLAFTNMGEFDQEAWFIQLRHQIFVLVPITLLLTSVLDALSNIFLLNPATALGIFNLFVLKLVQFLSLYVFMHLNQKLSSKHFKLKNYHLKLHFVKTEENFQAQENIREQVSTYAHQEDFEIEEPFTPRFENHFEAQPQIQEREPVAPIFPTQATTSPFTSPAFNQDEVFLESHDMSEEDIQSILRQAAHSMEEQPKAPFVRPHFKFETAENNLNETFTEIETEDDFSSLKFDESLSDNWLNPYKEDQNFFDASLTSPTLPSYTENVSAPTGLRLPPNLNSTPSTFPKEQEEEQAPKTPPLNIKRV